MKRKLLTQIRSEWRSNLWLGAELLVVSVVLWYVVDFFYASISLRSLPLGFDVEHVYLLSTPEVNVRSPEYIQDRTGKETALDRREIMERIRRRPEVEAVSWSQNSYPYNYSNSGVNMEFVNGTDTVRSVERLIRRCVSPDFVRVFRYEGANGETPEQLAEVLREGKVLVNNDEFAYKGLELKDYVGKQFKFNEMDLVKQLGAALAPVRYDDYSTYSSTVVGDMPPGWMAWANELCVRVKPGMDKDFAENIMRDAPSQLHVGNIMVTEARSFADIRRNFLRDKTNEERNFYTGMGFLLLNIFLGLLGTFWFRTQQRVGEIAIRKVNGATNRSIFRRLIGEGLLLLTVVTIPAALIDVLLSWYELSHHFQGYIGWGRTSLCILITYGLMALMIAGGILIPARRAMRVNPAIALKDE